MKAISLPNNELYNNAKNIRKIRKSKMGKT